MSTDCRILCCPCLFFILYLIWNVKTATDKKACTILASRPFMDSLSKTVLSLVQSQRAVIYGYIP